MIKWGIPVLTLGVFIACQSEPKTPQICAYPGEGEYDYPLPAFNNLEDAFACAREKQKPLLLWFDSWISCTRKMEEVVLPGELLRDRLKQEFVIARLMVDDKTLLPEEEWFIWTVNDREFKVKTLGRKNSYYQIERFQTNAQPYFAILTPDKKKKLEDFGYTSDPSYIDSLLTSALSKLEALNSQ
ncbi:hypothetical protein KFE98_10685 [bacterium SCSIO 12741]|nr:hypothetical protein KFE98_10685 [bacterium SCSIO 12741]